MSLPALRIALATPKPATLTFAELSDAFIFAF